MITLYGIKNCDTVKKARAWLEQQGVAHRFHDLRVDGIDAAKLKSWVAAVGWETLINTRGTTWRKLPDAAKGGLDASRALSLMLDHPTIIKRPVLESGTAVIVGFSAATYGCLLPRK